MWDSRWNFSTRVLIFFVILVDVLVGLTILGDDIINIMKQVTFFIFDNHLFDFIDDDRHFNFDYSRNRNGNIEIYFLSLTELFGISDL